VTSPDKVLQVADTCKSMISGAGCADAHNPPFLPFKPSEPNTFTIISFQFLVNIASFPS